MGYGDRLIQQGIEIGERRGVEIGVEIGERRGVQIGEHNGRVALAVELLSDRFGALPSWVHEHLQGADNDELRRVFRELYGATSLEALVDRSS